MKGPTKIFKRDDDIASKCFIFNLWLILPPKCWPAPSKSLTLPELAASMSIILPGVHTMISAPRFNSAICSEIPVPPGVRVLSKNWGKHNSTYDLSSELTVNTNHPGPSHGFDELSALLSYLQAQFPDEKKSDDVTLQLNKDMLFYLVGVMIIAMGPSPSSNGSWSAMCRKRGRRKAKVLPEK